MTCDNPDCKRRFEEGDKLLALIPKIASQIDEIHLIVCGRTEADIPGLIQKHVSNRSTLNNHEVRISEIEQDKKLGLRMVAIVGGCISFIVSIGVALWEHLKK